MPEISKLSIPKTPWIISMYSTGGGSMVDSLTCGCIIYKYVTLIIGRVHF